MGYTLNIGPELEYYYFQSPKETKVLDEGGLPVRFADQGYTESHQLLLDTDWVEKNMGMSVNDLANRLERQDIIVDAMCRLGTSEMTRRGMREIEMEQVAGLVIRAANGEAVLDEVHDLVRDLGLEFTL